MTYRGTLPSGQGFPGQLDPDNQMFGLQEDGGGGFAHGHPQPLLRPHLQPQHHQQQQQQQRPQPHQQPQSQHHQQAMYSGGVNYGQFYQGHQVQQGQYHQAQPDPRQQYQMQQQQQQQQQQRHQQHQQQNQNQHQNPHQNQHQLQLQQQQQQQQQRHRQMSSYGSTNFGGMFAGNDAGQYMQHQMQQPVTSPYMAATNVWQQPIQSPIQQSPIQQLQALPQTQQIHQQQVYHSPVAHAQQLQRPSPQSRATALPSQLIQQQQQLRQYQQQQQTHHQALQPSPQQSQHATLQPSPRQFQHQIPEQQHQHQHQHQQPQQQPQQQQQQHQQHQQESPQEPEYHEHQQLDQELQAQVQEQLQEEAAYQEPQVEQPESPDPLHPSPEAIAEPDPLPEEPQLEQPMHIAPEQLHFVNPQDILRAPVLPPLPMGNLPSLPGMEGDTEMNDAQPEENTITVQQLPVDPTSPTPAVETEDPSVSQSKRLSPPQSQVQPPPQSPPDPKPKPKAKQKPKAKTEPKPKLETKPKPEPKPKPDSKTKRAKSVPKSAHDIIPQKITPVPLPPMPTLSSLSTSIPPPPPPVKASPQSSVSNSPALSRSPGIVKKSPSVSSKLRPVNTGPIMIAIAEECLQNARMSVHDVASSLDTDRVTEYQEMISTSLSCLEASMHSATLPPREEAKLRLRYATLLQEETENLMEAEMALGKGITLCDKHRLLDLKYCMQYVMLKVLFQRSHKAALKAVDGHISNCQAFKHVQWYYAFRLLKSSFYMEIGISSDAGALENIRSIQNLATTRGDSAVSVLASLLEGLAHLKNGKDGSAERVQGCLAQAAKYQFDETAKILQLDMLTLLLDVSASMQYQSPDIALQKLRQLQKRLDECDEWHNVKADFLVPVKRHVSAGKTVSEETAAIIRLGDEAGCDYLVMSFMTKMELKALVFTMSGLANLHKPTAQGRRSTEFWREGMKILDSWDASTAGIPYGPPISLSQAIKQRAWRTEAQANLNILLGLLSASHCQWDKVKQALDNLDILVTTSTEMSVRLLHVYLKGVHFQGTGQLQTALQVFESPSFILPDEGVDAKAGHRDIALLAGLNRLWIMQHASCRNDQETMSLMEQLQPLCTNHTNVDLRTAWHNVVSALVTEPAQQLNQQKQHIHAAMGGSRSTNNILGAAVTLCIMRSRFFENVIGEQALKSARAAAMQAQRSGNILWQSVADGMLAQSYDVQGQRDEAKKEWDKATKEAREAFLGTS